MELKFTVKIRDEQNPPVFDDRLGKGVLHTVVIDFKGITDDDILNNPMFLNQLSDIKNKLKEDWIEVLYEKNSNT